jgi:hypothetical protein
MATETPERSFDELAKGLAEGSISRRRALKLFAGSAIAALIPSRALAGGHGHGKPEKCNDPCICHRPPGNPNNAQTLCIPKKAREAHLKNHPLDSCGPCGTTSSSTTPTTSTSTSTTSTSTSTSTTTPTTSTSTSTTSTSTTTPMCIPNGGFPCTADTQCCSRICDNRSPPSCRACRNPGGSCAAGETCCDVGSVNPSTCVNGKCCAPEQRPCNANIPCCPGLMCIDLGFGPICLS